MSSTTEDDDHADKHQKPLPPWPWIKRLREMTDPLQQRARSEENVDLPVELLPWLLLSDRKSAMNINKLKQRRVTHILSVHAAPPLEEAHFQERLEGTGIVQKRVHCDDAEGYDMIGRHWETCWEFLKHVKEDTIEGRVVVHCVAGINRSGLVACAGHMVLERTPLLEVVQHCLDRRGAVLWNRSFQRQLCDLAQRERLLGDAPKGYDDTPLEESPAAPPPAHSSYWNGNGHNLQARYRLTNVLRSKADTANQPKNDE